MRKSFKAAFSMRGPPSRFPWYRMARTLLTDLDPTAIFTPSLFIRREAFLSLGGFDAAAFGGEDYELGWRLKQQGVPIAYHPYFVVRHRDPPSVRERVRSVMNMAFGAAFRTSSHRMNAWLRWPNEWRRWSRLEKAAFALFWAINIVAYEAALATRLPTRWRRRAIAGSRADTRE